MRRDLPYIQEIKRSAGYSDFYYRRKGCQRQRIDGERHSQEFLRNYTRIHSSFEDQVTRSRGGFDHLCEEYMRSRFYGELKESSRREYRNTIDRLRKLFEGYDLSEITKTHINEMMWHFSDKPGTANNLLRVIKRVLGFAVSVDKLAVSPANGVKPLKGGEYPSWSDEEIDLFLSAETTSVEMKRVLLFALYTGQRQGDLIKMRWNDLSDGGVNVVQEKTAEKVWVPLHPELHKVIADMSRDNVNILTTSTNKRWSSSNVRNVFRETSRKAGVPKEKVFHGLRKSATVKLVEAGCTTDEVKAITGHKTTQMVDHYAKGTNQKRLALSAMDKLKKV